MNEITIFLAQMWGPILVVLGIGILTSRTYYQKIYRNLESETLALLATSVIAMAAGIAHVLYHNTWDSVPEIVITVLGWLLLIKGAMLALFPKAVDRFGDRAARSNLFSAAAVVAIILGGYITAVGYL